MSNSIDQQFVEYIVKSLVSKPDEVKIERRIDEKGVLLELTVDPEDLGRVIGKRGATAQSLRTLLRALGTKNDARYNLKIVDNGVEGGSRGRNSEGSGEGWSSKPSSSNDDTATAPAKDDAPASDNTTDDVNEDVIADEPKDDNSDTISKARKELEDLDDLDI
jgi:predicted RNA-binding protein YlqC (UPF0109 family)